MPIPETTSAEGFERYVGGQCLYHPRGDPWRDLKVLENQCFLPEPYCAKKQVGGCARSPGRYFNRTLAVTIVARHALPNRLSGVWPSIEVGSICRLQIKNSKTEAVLSASDSAWVESLQRRSFIALTNNTVLLC